MYNDLFDKELIDYLLAFLEKQKVDSLAVTSDVIGDNIYRIRFENSNFVLQLLYEKADNDCEAQIRLTNVLLKENLKGIGLSKDILNALFDYCREHGDMSLWIYELINQRWCNYLLTHGATMVQEETQFDGAILLINNRI